MKEIDKYKFTWEKIVDELYIQNDEFDYKKVKKIYKQINIYYKNITKKITEINTTLELTDFNEKEEVKDELKQFLKYLNETEGYLQNFIKYEPTTKQGYYNYLKSVIYFL